MYSRMTWLKRRLKQLGLFRRGPRVQYSSLSNVQRAIEVHQFLVCCLSKCYVCVHVGGTKRLQSWSRLQTDVDDSQRKRTCGSKVVFFCM